MNHRRVPEDHLREGFFTNEILKAAAAIGERIVLVLCSAPVCRTQKSSHVSRRPGMPGGPIDPQKKRYSAAITGHSPQILGPVCAKSDFPGLFSSKTNDQSLEGSGRPNRLMRGLITGFYPVASPLSHSIVMVGPWNPIFREDDFSGLGPNQRASPETNLGTDSGQVLKLLAVSDVRRCSVNLCSQAVYQTSSRNRR